MPQFHVRSLVVCAAATLAVASSAQAVTYTYDWHDRVNALWSNNKNWVGNVAPVSATTTELVFNLDATSINGAGTSQDIINPFELRGITYAATDQFGIRINGSALKFNNDDKYIANNNNSAHQINVD